MDASQFDDIRPYVDAEIPAAMARIADSEVFALLSAYVFPDRPLEEVREEVRGYKSVYEFQHGVMWFVNKQIEARSTAGVKVTGLENLDTRRNYLFVSNHRDIMLDASFLQNALVEAGHDTTEITFGANLMHPQLVVDIGCSNKMFKVERGDGTPRAFYESSKHLSDYIRYTILEKKQSVWIAQRNGRTKDGNDATAPGIIKMFGMSGGKDKVDALAELGITPVAISYEWEPCDFLKALELYQSRFEKYVKKPGEDFNSILTGITQDKGQVSIHVCEPLSELDLKPFSGCTSIEFTGGVAALVDSRIFKHYKLYPNNFIAHDLRYGQNRFADRYTPAQKEAFLQRLGKLCEYEVEDPDMLKDIFLSIYSNPIGNCLK